MTDCNGTACAAAAGAPQQNMATAEIIEIGMYCVILLVGGPLNVLSFLRSMKAMQSQRTPSQIILLRVNLNIADLLTLFVYVPKQIIWLLTYQWYGGELLCRVCSFFSTFSFYLNSFVIACIAIDRVYGAYNISSLNVQKRAYERCRSLLLAGWIAAFVFSLPQTFIFGMFEPFEDFQQCTPVWTTFSFEKFPLLERDDIPDARKHEIAGEIEQMQRWEKTYNILHLLCVFWIPAVIVVVSYLTVLLLLQGLLQDPEEKRKGSGVYARKRSILSEGSRAYSTVQSDVTSGLLVTTKLSKENSNATGDDTSCMSGPAERTARRDKIGSIAYNTIHRARQVAKRQAALILAAYLTFWSPYNVIAVMNLVYGRTLTASFHQAITFLNALICANPIVNPIIYGLFRK